MASGARDIAAFISRDAITACVDRDVLERPYCQGTRYLAQVDPSGGSNDSFALSISHMEHGQAMLDLVREVRPPFSPESAVGEFCEVLAAYKITRVQGDRYAGEWPREQFRKRNVRYDVCDKTASQLFLELLPLINAGTCRLLDHKRLLDQLVNLERRTSFGTGRDTIGHPPGCLDDLAVAVAGSLVQAMAKRPQIYINGRNYEQQQQHMAMVKARRGGRSAPHFGEGLKFIRIDEQGNELTAEEACAMRHTLPGKRIEG